MALSTFMLPTMAQSLSPLEEYIDITLNHVNEKVETAEQNDKQVAIAPSYHEVITEMTNQYSDKLSTAHDKITDIELLRALPTKKQLQKLTYAVGTLLEGAKNNDADSIYLLGLLNEVTGDEDWTYNEDAYKNAKVLYEKAQELGSKDAIYSLGELYYYGNGVDQDYEKSFEYYSDPLLTNYPEAIFSRAVQFDSGEGVPQDYKESFTLFKEAADLGHVPSTFNVGYMYDHGEYVDQSNEEALKWYQKACDMGDSDACISTEIVSERIDAKNAPKAESTRTTSPKNNSSLQSLYEAVIGTVESVDPLELTSDSILNADNDQAAQFLRDNSETLLTNIKENNDAESLFLVGYLFYLENLNDDNDQTLKQAVDILQKADEQGDENATFYLGKIYLENAEDNSDYIQGRSYLEKLRNSDNAEALFYLAAVYDQGLGVPQNYRESFNLYKRGAELGDAASAYNVGFMYEHGEYVDKDIEDAQTWYSKACVLGDTDGCDDANRLELIIKNKEERIEKVTQKLEDNIKELFDGILNAISPEDNQ